MRKGLSLFLIFSIFILGACDTIARADTDYTIRPMRAVATTGMVADIVENVGGERVDVIMMMGPGIDPHSYKASEGDVTDLANADVVFYNGLHLEAQLGEVFERMEGRIRAAAVAERIDPSMLVAPPQFEGAYDPHVWFDVSLWMEAVKETRDTLIEMDPGSEEIYQENAERYLVELEDLHEYVKSQVERVPPEKRVLLTAHDAFGYFGKAYGFNVQGLQGISTASEASTADVQRLVNFIVEHDIPALFVESSVPPRTIEAVQAAVRARGNDVEIGGELFSDAMGNPGTPEGTYVGMVKHNVDIIVGALLGE